MPLNKKKDIAFFFVSAFIIIFLCNMVYATQEYPKLQKQKKLKDTLFEKIVWHKKVSHIVIEERKQRYLVTLLMIIEYPYNYKSTNYPLHYHFSNIVYAKKKFLWLDKFFKNNGVMKVQILGSNIIKETILYQPAHFDEKNIEK